MPILILELEEGALSQALSDAPRPGSAPPFPCELRAPAEQAPALPEKHGSRPADHGFTGFPRHSDASAPPGPPPLIRVVAGEGIVEVGPVETAAAV
jgi:hypothetical protein